MPADFITLDGGGSGSVAEKLLANGFDPRVLKGYEGPDGRGTYVNSTDRNGKEVPKLISNAPSTMRKDEWIKMDETVIKVAKPRLKFFGDIRSSGLNYVIPNGFAKSVLQYEDMGDISPATISMSPRRRSESDRPEFDIKNFPLPIIHKDFHIDARELAISRNGSTPFDTTMVAMATERVAEEVEKLSLGIRDEYQFGGGVVYGLSNFPSRITGTLTNPTLGGWTAATLISEILDMRQASVNNNHYGPWRLYNSPDWDPYLDEDYSTAKGDNTVRQRIEAIRGIESVNTLDFLSGLQMFLLEMKQNVVRNVIGMEMTTVQWGTHGDFELHFKVMCILLTQFRADQYGQTGVIHYSAPAGT